MRRAIHMGDCLTLFDHWPPMRLLIQQRLTTEVVSVEPDQMDGIGICFSPMPDDQWHALVSLLRHGMGRRTGIPAWRLRLYEQPADHGRWRKLPDTTVHG